MQADLIDVGNLSHENGGIKFLLTIICSFTKKAWIHPIKSKKSDVVLHAFKTLLKQIPKTPRSILMDAGGEFILVRKWCAENNIKTYLPLHLFMDLLLSDSIKQLKTDYTNGWTLTNLKNT